MSDIRLNSNGDIDLSSGNMSLVDGVDAIVQLLSQRLKFFLGEWFLDIDQGVPYYQEVLTKNPHPVIIDSLFKSEILSTPGVIALNAFNLQYDSSARTLALSFQAKTTQGIVNFNSGDIGQ